MGVKVLDRSSGLLARVLALPSTPADGALLVNPPMDPADGGFVALAAESDAGSVTGERIVRSLDISRDYRTRIGMDSLLFNAKFPGAAIDTGRWTQILSTMTATVAGGFLTLNAGLSTATGVYAMVRSYRCFPVLGSFGLWAQANIHLTQFPAANNVVEIGLFLAATNAAPTDGILLRIDAGGVARIVANNAGVETQGSIFDAATILAPGTTHKMVIGVFDAVAELWIDDILVSVVEKASSNADLSASSMLPFAFRVINSGVTGVAQALKIGQVNVSLADSNAVKLWSHMMAGMGAMGAEGQAGGTLGSTALYTNNLAAGAGVAATNTTAALGSGLGGQFALQPTLTVGTDGIICSYQVPAGTNALPGKSLYIRGVKIHGVVTTLLAGGPVIAAWSLAYGHTSVSLATTESATAKAPRRIPIGVQVFPANAAVGSRDDREAFLDLETPVCVQPGEFVQCVLKNLGTVTTAGVIVFLISFDSYWE